MTRIPNGRTRFGVSETQRMMWVVNRLAPHSPAYNVVIPLRVAGAIDAERLGTALHGLVGRHPILRSVYRFEDGELHAEVTVEPGPILQVVPAASEREASSALAEFAQRPFDLAEGPLFRVALIPVPSAGPLLCFCAHHIIADFASFETILDDLERLYRQDGGAPCGTEDINFFDFVAEERAYLRSRAADEAIAFWKDILPPAPAIMPAIMTDVEGRTATGVFGIPDDTRSAFRRLGGLIGRSDWCVAIAAWAMTLAEVTGEPAVTIGFPTNIREGRFARTVGNFVNPLPVPVAVLPGTRRVEVAAQVLATVSQAVAHRRMPFSRIVSSLGHERTGSSNPVFQTIVNVLGPRSAGRYTDLHINVSESAGVPWAGVELHPFFIPQQEGQVDLSVEFIDSGSGLRGYIKRHPEAIARYDLDDVERRFRQTLNDIAADPDGRVGTGPAARPVPEEAAGTATVVTLFDAACVDWPEKVAVAERDRTVTYAELRDLSYDVANDLVRRGLTPGERVGLLLRPSAAMIAAMLGIMRAGGSYVPLDPEQPVARLRGIVDNCAVACVVAGDDAASSLMPEERVVRLGAAVRDRTPIDRSDADGLAYTLFTSGSTGHPKGIDVRHRNVAALLRTTRGIIETDEADVWCWFHAASFDLSVWEIWGGLSSGATVAVTPTSHRHDPHKLLDFLRDRRVTVLQLTPSALNLMRNATTGTAAECLRVKHLVSCGEALPWDTAQHFLPCTGSFWNMYGPAETTVYATVQKVADADLASLYVPIGRPLPGYRVYLLDEDLKEVPTGAEGEIFIAGVGVAAGYTNAPEQTRERFVPDVVARDGTRMYRTGDFAVSRSGILQYIGRKDQQVKIHGYRVDLLEIEAVIRRAAYIRDAAVLSVTRTTRNSLVAFVVFADGAPADAEAALNRYLRAALPAYMVPAAYWRLSEMPFNAHRKIDRAALRARLDAATALPPPLAGNVAAIILACWQQALGRTDLSDHDQFFDVGGDSFSLFKVYDLLQAHGIFSNLTPMDLFKYPTVEALARFATEGAREIPGARTISYRRRQSVARPAREE